MGFESDFHIRVVLKKKNRETNKQINKLLKFKVWARGVATTRSECFDTKAGLVPQSTPTRSCPKVHASPFADKAVNQNITGSMLFKKKKKKNGILSLKLTSRFLIRLYFYVISFNNFKRNL